MNKDLFIQNMAHLQEGVEKLQDSKKELAHDYLESCCPFSIDQKVAIHTPERQGLQMPGNKSVLLPASVRFAFITRITVGKLTGEFSYKMVKCRKDGSPSLMSDYCSNTPHIKAV